MPSNRVKIEICGTSYMISTDEQEDYVQGLAQELDEMMHQLLEGNGAMSAYHAMLLCCLQYLDQYRKSEQNLDRIRSQLAEYLEDAARARIELDEARREVDRLKRELESK